MVKACPALFQTPDVLSDIVGYGLVHEHERAGEPHLAPVECGSQTVMATQSSEGDERGMPTLHGIGQYEFQLSHLVAAVDCAIDPVVLQPDVGLPDTLLEA